jgi:hypothetical protein
MNKVIWSGQIVSVQPRIRLTRSFDERYHSYLGYYLLIDGVVGDERREFSIGIGKGAYKKHQFCVGDGVSGAAVPVADERKEPVEFYRVSSLIKSYRAKSHKVVSVRLLHSVISRQAALEKGNAS